MLDNFSARDGAARAGKDSIVGAVLSMLATMLGARQSLHVLRGML